MKRIAILISILLAVSLALCGTAFAEEQTGQSFGQWLDSAATSVTNMVKESGEVEVQGRAVRTVVPDTVTISVGASIEKKEVQDAQSEATRIINDVIAALKALGVPEKNIATSGYSIYRTYDYSKDKTTPTGYNTTISLKVKVTDFALINTILDTAVSCGANDVGNLSFSYSDEGTVYKEALKDAIKAARGKVEAMAEAAGVELQALKSMRETSYPTAVYNSYAPGAMMDSGGTDVMAGEMEISANVTLVYQVK